MGRGHQRRLAPVARFRRQELVKSLGRRDEFRRWARRRNLEVRFVASEGPSSHGTLYAGDRKTTVKDRKKETGKGLLGKNAR